MNIMIFVLDQLSATALRAYGNTFARTPNLDRLMSRGTRFESCYTPCPLCQPARASFWTGRYPHRTGVLSNGRLHEVPQLSDEIPTLGDCFSAAGYTAVHFGKCHDAGSLRGFNTAEVIQKDVEFDPAFPVNYDTRQDRDTREKVVEFLETYQETAPYIAVADLNNPHNICGWIGDNRWEHDDAFSFGALPELPENYRIDDWESLPVPVQYTCCTHNRQAHTAGWNETNFRHYLKAYHHYLERADEEVGRIIEALESRPDFDETLLVFFTDHGDAMGSRQMATKHTSFYDETTHVPLLFAGPGIKESDVSIPGLCSLLDVVPTLCEYAGIPAPPCDGQSLMSQLKQEVAVTGQPQVISQWHTEWGFTIEPGRMLRTDRWKYTIYREGNGEELYDMVNDPLEMKNLAANPDYAKPLAEMRAQFADYLTRSEDPFESLKWQADPQWRTHQPGLQNHHGPAAPEHHDNHQSTALL